MLGAIGIQYSLTCAPLAIGFYLSMVIGLGGSPAYFWGFIVTGVFQLFVCLAVSELASAIPHSAGPAYWVISLAGTKHKRTVGYAVGWLSNAGWFLINSACVLYPAELTMSLVEATHDNYVSKAWHTYLLYVAFALVFLTINLPRVFKVLNWIVVGVCFAINFTALYLFISLLVRVKTKQPAQFVFIEYINESGWSNGTVFFVGLLPSYACLAAFDNATHLTDEMENPRKQVPLVIIGSFLLSFLTGLPMLLVYEFCNVDPISLLTAVGGQPLMQLMINAFDSNTMAIFGMVMIILCLCVAGISSLVSWSRLYWSSSCERLMPFSGTMSKLSSRDSLPLNSLFFNTALTLLIGLISLGSHTAMNALLGAANLCLISVIVAALGLALFRGRKRLEESRWLNLGGLTGDAIFIIATLWSLFIMVMLCFPLYLPVTPEYMNWSSVVFAGILSISGLYWVAVFRKQAPLCSDHQPGHSREMRTAKRSKLQKE
ncbi:hypothetical protein ASPVEDRAFT_178051 [Aspergillus versicolor CBS 583.65]|uniref:Amino acid permease/ SLC12A domain-containing protein n=1 Tax=Aspergillus versicolor CBS 583.65 TaxID=1036611 RepID=A0A1L9Q0X3_ASPVE|nr:uncharacterized protein ASPVEDRAFT_178051 [Aspergillus versicolor CBS 583.65]OJJ07427.1 hypothetical protein ASPVEDRAFT_178051 [Aspergillus versicolor CBS 583.65]